MQRPDGFQCGSLAVWEQTVAIPGWARTPERIPRIYSWQSWRRPNSSIVRTQEPRERRPRAPDSQSVRSDGPVQNLAHARGANPRSRVRLRTSVDGRCAVGFALRRAEAPESCRRPAAQWFAAIGALPRVAARCKQPV